MIKPDAVYRRIDSKIVELLLSYGMTILNTKNVPLGRKQAEELYTEHRNSQHFNDLIDSVVGPVVIMEVTDEKAYDDQSVIKNTRTCIQSIRKAYGLNIRHNSIHASDSIESAERELRMFFR
jgi:nucleoside-diphosphate kinase